MAQVDNNIFIRGLKGSLGDQFVVRKGKGGKTIIANKSTYKRKFNETQVAHQQAFRKAIAYAKDVKDNEVYLSKAANTDMSPFNAAVADWFNQPEVLEIDLSAWTRAPGQTIRVEAQDDVQVTEVTVLITDENGTTLEEGMAVQESGSWWTYTTKSNTENVQPKVVASAKDLPGHITSLTMNWN
jgi:hypothetical protein